VEGIVVAHLQCADSVKSGFQTFHVWLPSAAALRRPYTVLLNRAQQNRKYSHFGSARLRKAV
jgi:hypothetical protein